MRNRHDVLCELFGGWNSYETRIIRKYLFEKRRQGGFLWFYAVNLYQRHGRKWAEHIKTHPKARWFAQKVFDWLFRKAQMEIPERAKRVVFDSYWEATRRERGRV